MSDFKLYNISLIKYNHISRRVIFFFNCIKCYFDALYGLPCIITSILLIFKNYVGLYFYFKSNN